MKRKELGLTLLESALGAVTLLSLLIASIDGYSAFRILALLHDAGQEAGAAYANADANQALSGPALEAFASDRGYELLQKTIPPTEKNCSGTKWCCLISFAPLPLGSVNPSEVQISVQYDIPLMLLGSTIFRLSRTVTKRLESSYVSNKTALYRNSSVCDAYGGSCVW